MAKPPKPAPRKQTNKRPPLDVDDDDDDDDDDEREERAAAGTGLDDQGAKLDEVLRELGLEPEAYITVNKSGPNGEERIGTFAPAEFNMEDIRSRYGWGTYWLYPKGGRGRLRDRMKLTFARPVGAGIFGATQAPQPPGEISVRELLDKQQQMQSQMFAELRGMVTDMARAGQGNPASSRQEFLEMMKAVKELLPSAPRGDSMETFLKGLTFGQKMNSGGGGESGFADVAMKFLEVMGPQLGGATVDGQTNALPAPGQGTVDMMAIITRLIATKVPILVTAAAKGSDPGVYAQLLIDQVPDSYQQMLVRHLQQPDWFVTLARIAPDVQQHTQWFAELREQVLGAFAPEQTTVAPPVDAGASTAGNGEASSR